MNKEKITREHRTLDDTDLRDINNTFKLIEKTLDSLKSELKSDINNIKWTIGFGFAIFTIAITVLKFFS